MVDEGGRHGKDIEVAMESDGGDSGADKSERRLMESDVVFLGNTLARINFVWLCSLVSIFVCGN